MLTSRNVAIPIRDFPEYGSPWHDNSFKFSKMLLFNFNTHSKFFEQSHLLS